MGKWDSFENERIQKRQGKLEEREGMSRSSRGGCGGGGGRYQGRNPKN